MKYTLSSIPLAPASSTCFAYPIQPSSVVAFRLAIMGMATASTARLIRSR